MKNLGIYSSQDIYGQAFFEGDKCIHYIHANDGYWHNEYFRGIVKHFGIKSFHLDEMNEKQKKSLKKRFNVVEFGEEDDDE
jgi:hypothetical protein